MQLVLISACLLGSPVRYNGQHKHAQSKVLQRWLADGRVVAVCPEVAGGLPVPRPPAEISAGAGGTAVLQNRAVVRDALGSDVSAAFIAGAGQALEMAQTRGIRLAVLKEGSPSCGSAYTYDGSFSGSRVQAQGVTAALLQSAGIQVFNESQFDAANTYLLDLEASESGVR